MFCSHGRFEYLLHRWSSLNSLVPYGKFADPFFIILPLASAQDLAELRIVHLFCSTLYSARSNHLTSIILPGNYLAKFLEFIEYIFLSSKLPLATVLPLHTMGFHFPNLLDPFSFCFSRLQYRKLFFIQQVPKPMPHFCYLYGNGQFLVPISIIYLLPQ